MSLPETWTPRTAKPSWNYCATCTATGLRSAWSRTTSVTRISRSAPSICSTAASLRKHRKRASERNAGRRSMATLWQDMRYAFRMLAKNPGGISFAVSQRTREIGVRMALGARPADVLRMILTEGLKLVAVGVALGIAAALLLTRLLEGMIYGVSVRDPLIFVVVNLLLVTVSLTACYVPARRAMRVDPLIALRYE